MRTFLKNFNINIPQKDVEFLDLDLDRDTKVFVDPFSISMSDNPYCKAAHKSIKSFMEELIKELKEVADNNKSDAKAVELCDHFSEPKGTGIGLSKNSYQGHGADKIKMGAILTALKSSEAISTGSVQDLEELVLVIEGIGNDTISDITINICMKNFAEYTLSQCQKLGISTKQSNEKLSYFCDTSREWKSEFFELPYAPVGENKLDHYIILLPRSILEKKAAYGTGYFFTNIATPAFVEQALSAGASFVYAIKNGERRVNKKEMRKHEEFKGGKKRMSGFIARNPESLKRYRDRVANYRYNQNQQKKKKGEEGTHDE